MSLNLWKLGGKPTSYNPLPTTWQNVSLDIGEYVLRFKAKSNGSSILRVVDEANVNGSEINQLLTLTSDMKQYELSFKFGARQLMQLVDYNSKGDIIIDSIELVQKPLPKLTINGIDGFLSGKWVLHANAQVVDDETLVLNATAGYQYNRLIVNNIQVGQIYTLSVDNIINGMELRLECRQGTNLLSSVYGSSKTISITVPNGADTLYVMIQNNAAGTFTFKRPMLNLGSTPAPYEKKRGERMVLPTLNNGKWQMNKKPQKYVPKKNLVESFNSSNWVKPNGTTINSDSSLKINSASGINVQLPVYLDMNKQYTITGYHERELSVRRTTDLGGTVYVDRNTGYGFTSVTFTPTYTGIHKIQLSNRDTANRDILFSNIQLEEGTTQTPYEPYQLVLPKARTGLSFNGVTDYLQLPSMTMDSIEIECLIDSVQGFSWNLLDGRTGFSNSWLGKSKGSSWNLFVDGQTKPHLDNDKGRRIKVLAMSNVGQFTTSMRLLADFNGTDKVKGTLYKVTCYLNGSIVAQYDFENNKTVVGNQVLQSPANLIPSFEDSRWSLHANTQVLGKDVLRLNASGVFQQSFIDVPCDVGKQYLLKTLLQGIGIRVYSYNIDGLGNENPTTGLADNLQQVVITPTTNKLRFKLSNANTGTFDFIRPQLYQLDGKEGTVNGSPTLQLKHAKRRLYNKR